MSTGQRRRLSFEQRRETIVQAATALFAQRGYDGASIDEIARRSGITAPVLYDHFASKRDLYEQLLEIHYAELRRIWRSNVDDLRAALHAWFAYVQLHPDAARMLFIAPRGSEIEDVHRVVATRSRDAVLPLLHARLPGAPRERVEAVWEIIRAALQGFALWWQEHEALSRDDVVEVAVAVLWDGLERSLSARRGVARAPRSPSPGDR